MLPALAGGIWWITSSRRFIGEQFKNRWWDHIVMALLFILAIYGTIAAAESVVDWALS